MKQAIPFAFAVWVFGLASANAQTGSPGVVPLLPVQGPSASEAVGPPTSTPLPAIPSVPPQVAPSAPPPSFPGSAQPSYPLPPPGGPPAGYPLPPPGPPFITDPGPYGPAPIALRPVYNPDAYTIWMRAELLVWWVKNAPMPINVVGSSDLVNNPNGTPLGASGNYGSVPGFRFAIGGWLESNHNIGIEANFFAISQRADNFSGGSDANGNPMLAFPFNNQTPGSVGPAILPITSPGAFSGGINVTSTLSLWGTDINGIFRIAKISDFEFTVLAGFRYMDMIENLCVDTSSQSLADNTLTNFHDSFATRNQFYGGQIGSRFSWQTDRLSFDFTGKLALGVTHEALDVQGTTVQFPGNSFVPNVYNGGFFAQPSNIGRTTANQFGVIPSAELKVNYALSPWCKCFVGYDFLYWNQVIRPGSNVDHNINLSQSAVLNGGAPAGGAIAPAPQFNRTDFWAQGVTFGVEFRY